MAMETHGLQAEKLHWQLTADQKQEKHLGQLPPMCQKTTMSMLNSIYRGNIDNKCEGYQRKQKKKHPKSLPCKQWKMAETGATKFQDSQIWLEVCHKPRSIRGKEKQLNDHEYLQCYNFPLSYYLHPCITAVSKNQQPQSPTPEERQLTQLVEHAYKASFIWPNSELTQRTKNLLHTLHQNCWPPLFGFVTT